jgi:predicted nucleotidyltransferase
MAVLDVIVPRLVTLPGVVAVVLGGSRARGTERPDSDWDIGLYYRGDFDARLIAGLGFPGHVAQPGEWGRIVNGGAWLSVDGEPVDVLLRDLDVVEGWWADARLPADAGAGTALSRWRTPRSTRAAETSPSPRERWPGPPPRPPTACSPSAASGC